MDFYSSYFPKAKAQLGVNEINPVLYSNSEFYKFSRVGEYEAQKAGFTTVKVPNVYDFSYMEKEDKNEAQALEKLSDFIRKKFLKHLKSS